MSSNPASLTQYVDFTITIDMPDRMEVKYIDQGQVYITNGHLSSDPTRLLNIERLHRWVKLCLGDQQDVALGRRSNFQIEVQDLKVIGLNLYQLLFSDEGIRKKFRAAYDQFQKDPKRGNRRMRLQLQFHRDAQDLSNLPWEFLYIPEQHDRNLMQGFFFSGQRKELILTRLVPQSRYMASGSMAENLRILVAMSTPSDAGPVDTTDLRIFFEQLEASPIKPTVQYLDEEHCTTDRFTETLQTFKPHIVHFVGHGKEGQLGFIKKSSDDDYDETKGGLQTRWVPADQLQVLITNSDWVPRLIFLHACKGAVASSNEAFNSCARELVYGDVPVVVAMQHSISNLDAAKFARTFYKSLGEGSDVDLAVREGRTALGNAYPVWEHPRFGTPVVYLQTGRPIVQCAPTLSDTTTGETQEAGSLSSASRIASVRASGVAQRVSDPASAAPASRAHDADPLSG